MSWFLGISTFCWQNFFFVPVFWNFHLLLAEFFVGSENFHLLLAGEKKGEIFAPGRNRK
ncbi:MAG: hypothetical protein V2G43_07570 [bacterium JZ-2024 1]